MVDRGNVWLAKGPNGMNLNINISPPLSLFLHDFPYVLILLSVYDFTIRNLQVSFGLESSAQYSKTTWHCNCLEYKLLAFGPRTTVLRQHYKEVCV